MLARLKGRNGAWGLLSLVNIGVGFLVVGLIEAEPDRATPKVRKLSIASSVVGSAFLVFRMGSFGLVMAHAAGLYGIRGILGIALGTVLFSFILLFLGYKLARIKGLNGAWTLLNGYIPGLAFLAIGFMKPAPDHDTPKSKKLSIAAIVVGGIAVVLQMIAYLLGEFQGM
jgi:hypothetical protein